MKITKEQLDTIISLKDKEIEMLKQFNKELLDTLIKIGSKSIYSDANSPFILQPTDTSLPPSTVSWGDKKFHTTIYTTSTSPYPNSLATAGTTIKV